MALSAQTDPGQDKEEAPQQSLGTDEIHQLDEKTFVPNPDAKPFIPADKSRFMKWHPPVYPGNEKNHMDMNLMFHPSRPLYNGLLMNGFNIPPCPDMVPRGSIFPDEFNMSPLMLPPDLDMLAPMLNGNHSPPKKHIAYHLLSTVLDDEIQEDHTKDSGQRVHQVLSEEKGVPIENDCPHSPSQNGPPQEPIGASRRSPSQPSESYEETKDDWPASVASLSSSFTLSLDVNSDIPNPSTSLGNKSIHDIWSPDPSPKGSYPSSPSDEVFSYNHRSSPESVDHAFSSSIEVSPPASSGVSSQDISPNSMPMFGESDTLPPTSAEFESPFPHQDGLVSRQISTGSQGSGYQLNGIHSNGLIEEDFSDPVPIANHMAYNPAIFAPPFIPFNNMRSVEANHGEKGAGDEIPVDDGYHGEEDVEEGLHDDHSSPPPPANDDMAHLSGYHRLRVHFDEGQNGHHKNYSKNYYKGNSKGHRNNYNHHGKQRGSHYGNTYHHYQGNRYSGSGYSRHETTSCVEQLGIGLDDCLDQLRCLEKECKRAEQDLSKIYPARRTSMNGSTSSLKLPPHPTRVDKMIAEQLKEHQRVESLIGRVERVGPSPMHPNVGVALDRWLACIRELQNLRRDEINNMQGVRHAHYGSKSYSEKDLLALTDCVKELFSHTRSARTIVWCAMQMLHADVKGQSRRSDSSSSLERSSDRHSSNS